MFKAAFVRDESCETTMNGTYPRNDRLIKRLLKGDPAVMYGNLRITYISKMSCY